MEIFTLKKGDRVVESLTDRFAKDETYGYFSAIGALSWAKIKVYDLKTKQYQEKEITGNLEVCNLTGLIAKLEDGKTAIHPHITLANEKFEVFGGHLEEGEVSATLEVVVFESEPMQRKFSEEIGLNLLEK